MLEEFYIENYGLGDLSTPVQINKLLENIDDDRFVENILAVVNDPITNIESYENNLKVKVILEYYEYIDSLIDSGAMTKLEQFYKKVNPNEVNKIKGKILSFINSNFEEIWLNDDYEIKSITLKWIISFGGFKKWNVLINNMGSMRNTCINKFENMYSILKKHNKEVAEIFVEKILIPIETQYNLKKQIDIYKMISDTYINIAKTFEDEMIEYIDGDDFLNTHIYNQNDLLIYIIESNVFSNTNKIKIQSLLENVEKEVSKEILKSGSSYKVTSDLYKKIEEDISVFREKLYFLVSDTNNSIYNNMYNYDFEKQHIMDIIGGTGVRHKKYGSIGFMTNLNFYELYISVSTKYVIVKYEDEFWKELQLLVEDVEVLSGISRFILNDIKTINILLEHKNYFVSCTLLIQVIERLLREIYLKINYGVVGFFKNIDNPVLGVLLDYERKNNILLEIFDLYEIEALHYFLCNKDYGRNLRNILAHYTTSSDSIRENEFLYLLHILIFILIKIDYKGVVFDK